MLKFKIDDTVKVLSGKDKGREGKIEKIFLKKGSALIQEINLYKKHVKGSQGQKGGIYDIPRPLPLAKIAVVCPNCKKTTRVGLKVVSDEKVRFCRKCNRQIDTRKTKK